MLQWNVFVGAAFGRHVCWVGGAVADVLYERRGEGWEYRWFVSVRVPWAGASVARRDGMGNLMCCKRCASIPSVMYDSLHSVFIAISASWRIAASLLLPQSVILKTADCLIPIHRWNTYDKHSIRSFRSRSTATLGRVPRGSTGVASRREPGYRGRRP